MYIIPPHQTIVLKEYDFAYQAAQMQTLLTSHHSLKS